VLVLDDDRDLREVLSEVLTSRLHVDCIAAGSVDELVTMRERVLGCALAILDVNLGPHTRSGIDAFEWLRSQGYHGSVAFLTGHADSHPLVRDAARIGDARVFQKPISLEALLALLGTV